MKYSIDVVDNKISGWVVVPNLDSIKVSLTFSDGSKAVTRLNHNRLDVVNTGLSIEDQSYCGFSFINEQSRVKDGSLLLVSIFGAEKEIHKSIFIGDKVVWNEKFEKFVLKSLDRKVY